MGNLLRNKIEFSVIKKLSVSSHLGFTKSVSSHLGFTKSGKKPHLIHDVAAHGQRTPEKQRVLRGKVTS